MNRAAKISVAISVVVSAACGGKGLVVADASSPPVDAEATPVPDRAKVCVLRPSATEGSTAHATHDNGVLVGATRGGSHFCYLAEPGDHTIRVDGGSEPINLTAKGGHIFYLNEEVTEIMGTLVAKLTWVQEFDAKPILTATKYVIIVSTPNDEQPKPLAPRK